MPSGTATVTASTGPARAVTAKVISGVLSFRVDIDKQMLYFNTNNSDPNGPQQEFSLSNTLTFVATVSSGLWTITVVVS